MSLKFRPSILLLFTLFCGQVMYAGWLDIFLYLLTDGVYFKQSIQQEKLNDNSRLRAYPMKKYAKLFFKELPKENIKAILRGEKYVHYVCDNNLDFLPQKNVHIFGQSLSDIFALLSYTIANNKDDYEKIYEINYEGTTLKTLFTIAEQLYKNNEPGIYLDSNRMTFGFIQKSNVCDIYFHISPFKIIMDRDLNLNRNERLYGSLNKIDFEKTYGNHGNMCKLGKYTDFDLKFDYMCLE